MTLLSVTAAVLETLVPPDQSTEDDSGIDLQAVGHFVPLAVTWEPDLAYSESAESRWVPADPWDDVAYRSQALPTVLFVIVQLVLLVETVVAFIGLQGQGWQPVGVLIIALLVMGLSVSFLAGASAVRTAGWTGSR